MRFEDGFVLCLPCASKLRPQIERDTNGRNNRIRGVYPAAGIAELEQAETCDSCLQKIED